MKLLPPSELNDAKAVNQLREAQRNVGMENVSKQIRQNLAKANADFSETMAKFKELWSIEERTHEERVTSMKKEITDLEEKKRLALLPIDIYQKQAKTMIVEAQKYLEGAKTQEHNVDLLRELLENKLDDVGEREQKVKLREDRLEVKEKGINIQNKQVSERSELLTKKMQEFSLERQTHQKDITDQQNALNSLQSQLEANKDILKRKEQELEDWKQKLIQKEKLLNVEIAKRTAL